MDVGSNFGRIISSKDFKSTSVLMIFIVIIGALLIWKVNEIKKIKQPENPDKIKLWCNIIMVIGVFLIIFPVIVLIFYATGVAGSLKFLSPLEDVLQVQLIVLVISATLLGIIVFLNTLLKDADNALLGIGIGFVVGSGALLGIRYYSDRKEMERINNYYTLSNSLKGLSKYSERISRPIVNFLR